MITSNTLFLVSGGARGITAQCVVALARRFHCKFILVGRSSLAEPEPDWAVHQSDETALKRRIMEELQAGGVYPTPAQVQVRFQGILARREILKTLEAITQAGGQAEYLSADIGDGADLRQKLLEMSFRLGPIRGIIHGAGILADKLIERKSIGDFEKVYAAKVRGLQNLLVSVPANQLDYLILFSSAAGFYGNSGQTDYALANEILNKVAHQFKVKHPHCRVLAINWGPWEGGMVTPDLKRLFNQRQIELIPLEAGAQFLADELQAEKDDRVQLVVGSPLSLIPAKVADISLRTYRLRRRLAEAANPFLQDHLIGGRAVLPMVCAVAWVSDAAEQLYPGFKTFKVEKFKVLKGIVFDDSLAAEYILDLKEIAKAETEISFEALLWSETGAEQRRYHYSTQLTLRSQLPEPPPYPAPPPLPPAAVCSGASLYGDGTLFHGPAFQGIRRILEINPERLFLEGRLPRLEERRQGQFPVQNFNPFIADVQFQSLVIWARHFHQAGSLPLKCQMGEQFKPIQFGETFYVLLQIQSSADTSLVASLITYNQQGQICTRLTGAEVTISKQLNPLFQAQNE